MDLIHEMSTSLTILSSGVFLESKSKGLPDWIHPEAGRSHGDYEDPLHRFTNKKNESKKETLAGTKTLGNKNS